MDHLPETVEEKFTVGGMPVLCLPLSSNNIGYNDPEHPETNKEGQFACGLVLRPVPEQGCVYERIGHFHGWDLDDGFNLERLVYSLSKTIEIIFTLAHPKLLVPVIILKTGYKSWH
ncbi:hypothetical protein B0T25DRAFT_523061 [Lasiosphaeria hispida]|uniref:Uncharacterized protein n=1 Tax=Lasiosphaeria hispida TaxID=260671 RepID=A0AAJ0H749_9PEZI|nr:hypothetical protein B0T25DRAFT_523061 [Lasiosphaeria hispida]